VKSFDRLPEVLGPPEGVLGAAGLTLGALGAGQMEEGVGQRFDNQGVLEVTDGEIDLADRELDPSPSVQEVGPPPLQAEARWMSERVSGSRSSPQMASS
jgi:hypothetical protein